MRRYTGLSVSLLLVIALLVGCSSKADAASVQATATTATIAPVTATLEPTTIAPAEGAQASTTATPAWQPAVGVTAADFALQGVDGRTHKLSEYLGQPVILCFFATWCPHCQSEMPILQQVYTDREGDGFVLLAVSVAETPDTVAQFVDEQGLTFPVLIDADGEIGTLYQVSGIPASYFIDRNGLIRGSHVGAITEAAALNSVVDQLLQ